MQSACAAVVPQPTEALLQAGTTRIDRAPESHRRLPLRQWGGGYATITAILQRAQKRGQHALAT
jgi:hypothetical protein